MDTGDPKGHNLICFVPKNINSLSSRLSIDNVWSCHYIHPAPVGMFQLIMGVLGVEGLSYYRSHTPSGVIYVAFLEVKILIFQDVYISDILGPITPSGVVYTAFLGVQTPAYGP